MPHNIVIAGCGKIGLKLALALAPQNKVYGLKRNAAQLPPTITGISADITNPTSLRDQLPSPVDYVVYCLTASQFNDETYRQIYIEGLRNLINELERSSLTPKRLFFVSSSSVYQQDNDQWVDEETPVEPSRFSGMRLLEAEKIALDCPIPATNVRFSGIYGGNRTRLLEQVKSGTIKSNATAYTNRIHEDDCVLVLKHLIENDMKGEHIADCYLASDSEPVRMNDLISWMSEEFSNTHSSETPKEQQTNTQPPSTAGKSQRRAGSKRCSNKRLIASGYKFKYPTFREGYSEMIGLPPARE
ncbi:NAD-dependent epimerase/dehydratase family protein [Alkalimarinus alittae]|uniref:NAD-dependent epimerase/dehydratase family protein n=1 Tax=Alkalimarinus alittae TaxID=2961619 RepID=A0ABY6N1C1_9ALTE|nr:NAD-dependent epimerase/dehydratase family protein [Alkalimarinus alittae]UZE95907.1 NAD-dependent epimerase/dehydratase family protein [Alkalimarinus alittae]